MSQEFTICNQCGNIGNKHMFKHIFIGRKIYKNINNEYILDANDFNQHEKVSCNVPQCKLSNQLHNTVICSHKFIPKTIKYRKIFLKISDDAICSKTNCFIPLEKHNTIMTHKFMVKIKILNKGDDDIVDVSHTDDDINIDTEILN
jgi:hypothetical protein